MNFQKQIAEYLPQSEQEQADRCLMLELIERYGDGLMTRNCRFAHMASSGFIINQTKDKCLFGYHRIFNAWGLTGGHADGEPDLLKVALQEAKEETGLSHPAAYWKDIASLDVLPVHGHWKNGSYVNAHLHLCATFVLVADEAAPIRPKEDENTAVRWFSFEEIPVVSREPHMLPIYQKLIERIKRGI